MGNTAERWMNAYLMPFATTLVLLTRKQQIVKTKLKLEMLNRLEGYVLFVCKTPIPEIKVHHRTQHITRLRSHDHSQQRHASVQSVPHL
jgi:hypothetical protein